MSVHSQAAQIIGGRIREARAAVGLTAREAARFADMDLTNLQRIERGVSNPTVTTLVKIAHALGIDPGDLVAGLTVDHLPEQARERVHSTSEFAEWLASRRGVAGAE